MRTQFVSFYVFFTHCVFPLRGLIYYWVFSMWTTISGFPLQAAWPAQSAAGASRHVGPRSSLAFSLKGVFTFRLFTLARVLSRSLGLLTGGQHVGRFPPFFLCPSQPVYTPACQTGARSSYCRWCCFTEPHTLRQRGVRVRIFLRTVARTMMKRRVIALTGRSRTPR